ncbi:MAG TPA: SUMF1/EgtB/PvdO family nonheme iron enzyme [Janthinobacterium sp.]|nr:SUMF1/EgtB/PvdO family nonheme iron enzyme [Janthinobacterium sp.]
MQTARDKIRELRALHDDGLLSQQEFDLRKNAILDAEYAPPTGSPVPHGPAAAPAPARQGTELGLMAGQEIGPQNRRYRLERLIAMGGMGQVWQATDLATHAELGNSEMVALKILPPQLTQSATHARLLIEEATQARKLAHENIVRVYEWAQDPATSSYFIIMECLEGEDLDNYLGKSAPLGLDQVRELLHPVADALAYAWEKHKLVHRDIKPGNVFLTRRGEIKLLDFGIASRVRNAGSSLGLETPNAGTTGYRAPEAGTHQRQPSPRLDVYAVAVMIYQMLEGKMPFDDARSTAHLPSAPAALNAAQWQVLQNGFSLTAELRPASVRALLEALQRAAGPSEAELAEQARLAAEQAELVRRQDEQRRKEQAAQAEQARLLERRRQEELALKRKAEAQAAAAGQLRLDQLRKEQEARRRIEEEAARKARKETLREQLRARREADAAKARQEMEEQQRKVLQARAEAAQRAEQERARKELAARAAAELAQLLPTPASPVADADGVLRDRFLDGSGKGPDLVLIPTGRFQMGVPDHERAVAMAAGSQKSWLERETPQHWVGIEHSFALGRYPVTVGQWRQFVRATGWQTQSEDTDWDNPGFVQNDAHPVIGVNWNDVQLYLRWLSEMTGQVYRLPSEAEWEYACRAGTRTAFSFGDTIGSEQANYDGNFIYNGGKRGSFIGGTSKVGSYPANPWGLFDMHGNVWEWVQDVVHENYEGAPVDGRAWEEGGDPGRRVLRGGSWLYNPRYLRSALRNGFSAVFSNDIVGFRVARKLA